MNEVGLGQGAISDTFADIPKPSQAYDNSLWKTGLRETTFRDPEAPMRPEFTTPLNGRTLVVGYNGTLTCAIRGRPRTRIQNSKPQLNLLLKITFENFSNPKILPRIKWFKNQIEIENDPKFKISWGQGIIQLEIRRAERTDAGTYTCLASNELGEAAVTADVFVRDPTVINHN